MSMPSLSIRPVFEPPPRACRKSIVPAAEVLLFDVPSLAALEQTSGEPIPRRLTDCHHVLHRYSDESTRSFRSRAAQRILRLARTVDVIAFRYTIGGESSVRESPVPFLAEILSIRNVEKLGIDAVGIPHRRVFHWLDALKAQLKYPVPVSVRFLPALSLTATLPARTPHFDRPRLPAPLLPHPRALPVAREAFP
jgi:hypothetical protein